MVKEQNEKEMDNVEARVHDEEDNVDFKISPVPTSIPLNEVSKNNICFQSRVPKIRFLSSS